ncbi:replication protein [Xenorhabdus sp. XENO-7]|uniref:Replication protein n=1 Tax=Xenorhabdus aichiensis TaxID=3025874 RepID=A0ABT5M8X4_9GAMM|nr:replication protein [Xenorhabdus aichiensis]MDC9623987.1 replication protein [Xenorhabdus aichiensis]
MSNVAYADFGAKNRQERPTVANLEDGFTMLANELYDALIGADLTRNQAKVAHAVCRKTYGFKKKVDRITDSQIAGLCKISREKVNIAKNELISMKVLIKDGKKIGPNKNIYEWEIPECDRIGNIVTKTVTKSVTESITEDVTNLDTHKRNTLKKKENKDKNILPEQVQAECNPPPHEPAKKDQIQSAFETIFWLAGMRKVGKPKALSSFKSQFKAWRKETGGTPEQFAEFLAADIRLRLQAKIFGFENLHPTTYLNGQRWTDEKPVTNTPTQSTTGQSGITVSESGLVFLD